MSRESPQQKPKHRWVGHKPGPGYTGVPLGWTPRRWANELERRAKIAEHYDRRSKMAETMNQWAAEVRGEASAR